MPLPSFDHNNVLPPHRGNPTVPSDLSPYACTTVELCERFAFSPERKTILKGYLDFRQQLRTVGIRNGFQWIDGSFLEDIEASERRSPRDIDVVTVFEGYDLLFLKGVNSIFPEFFSPQMSKTKYGVDHYPFQSDISAEITIEFTRYWISLFSHNRLGVWKGMLRINIDTPSDDVAAEKYL